MDVFAATKIQQSLLSDVQHTQTKEKKKKGGWKKVTFLILKLVLLSI